jgi:multidrug efflux pump subunit AcrB
MSVKTRYNLWLAPDSSRASTMTLTKLSLSNPVAVVVACILIAIFGVLSLTRLPIQMTPEISRPEISIMTPWRASAPNEIESEIIEPQEDVLRSIPGLLKMQSSASYGNGSINLQFEIGTEMNRALIEVMNRLNQVPRYPISTRSSRGGRSPPSRATRGPSRVTRTLSTTR